MRRNPASRLTINHPACRGAYEGHTRHEGGRRGMPHEEILCTLVCANQLHGLL